MFINFTFNKVNNENYGVICTSLSMKSGVETVSDGSVTELNTAKSPLNNKWYVYDTEYSEPIQFKIQLINNDFSDMTVDKRRAITKWLCLRNEYSWLSIDKEGYEGINYNVIISNPNVIMYGRAIGMEFTVTCDSSFGYSDIIRKSFNITNANQTINIVSNSDEMDYIYPKMQITMNSTGNFSIVNNHDNLYKLSLENLTINEVITLDNENCIINTSLPSHMNLMIDFNKHWLRLVNGENELMINGNCQIELEYREIRKVGVEL